MRKNFVVAVVAAGIAFFGAEATPLDQIKSDMAKLEADLGHSAATGAFLQNDEDQDYDDNAATAAEEARLAAAIAEDPEVLKFGDNPQDDEIDESMGPEQMDSGEDEASSSGSACAAARGVCMDHAATNCRAPRATRRGLCTGTPSHNMCCVGAAEGGSVAAPTTGVATNRNWLTSVGGVTVTKMDRSGRRSFPAHTPNKFVVHTTEGWWPRPGIDGSHGTLDQKSVWSHFIIGYARDGKMKVYQYLPLNVRSSALKANNMGSIQVEVSAIRCCPFTTYDKELTDLLRALFTAVRAACPNIKNEVIAPTQWVNPVRFTVSAWNAASGLTGHMTAPRPDNHNDPGPINPSMLLSDFAGAAATYKSKEELRTCLKACTANPWIRDYYSVPNREISFTKF